MTDLDATVRQRWGRSVTTETVDGHPLRLYEHRPHCLAEFLLEARRWHDRELLVQGDRRLTYGDFESAVAAASDELRARGVGSGDRVLLLGFNSIEWVITFWAIQAVGATTVLGNAWWSDEEAAGAIRHAEPTVTVTDRDLDTPTIDFGTIRTAVADAGSDRVLVPAEVDEESLAIIMFTSGTTGAPKGVLMSHRSVIANIQNLLALTGRLPDELPADHRGTVSLLTVPLFHLAGIQVVNTTLLSGGRIVLLERSFKPDEVLTLIERERVRAWGTVPTMVSRVIGHPDFAKYDTSSVASIGMGGAPVSPELRSRINAQFSGVKQKVGSLYGLTEAGGVLAAGTGTDITSRPGCVGRALPVVELRIANPNAEGTGEIQARTPTATGGYLGDPNPLTDSDGWLSSGDLGRIDEDGWLYVTGRSKDVIIRGGENISVVHVENQLGTHEEVLEVAVVAIPDADLGESVGAAVVVRPDSETSAEDLRAHALERLARFEVPDHWWLRTEPLPTNPTGKIVRAAVRESWLERRAAGVEDGHGPVR